MMNKFSILFLFVAFICNGLFAQTEEIGAIEYYNDYSISKGLSKHIVYNSRTINKGYRIKIQFGSDKRKSLKLQEEFNETYEDVLTYIKYDQPYFSVRVGNYRTKIEAYKFFKQIQEEYPASFIVVDEIEFIKKEVVEEDEEGEGNDAESEIVKE